MNSPGLFYVKEKYRGYTIVEVQKSQTQIHYEFAQAINGTLHFSSETFSNIELAKDFIDNLIQSMTIMQVEDHDLQQSVMACQKCSQKFDLRAELIIDTKYNCKSLAIKQRCNNCNESFMNFNTVLN